MEMGMKPFLLEEMRSALPSIIFPFTKCAGEPNFWYHHAQLVSLLAEDSLVS